MKNAKKKVTVIIAAAVLVTAGAAVITPLVPKRTTNRIVGTEVRDDYKPLEEKKEYSVLVYMNGSSLENEQEQLASEDIEEMKSVTDGDENYHLVVEQGGSSVWEKQSRFSIQSSGIRHFEEMATRNMGDKSTLADFLNYGIMSYPAEKYLLIMWNHGNGPVEGFGSDELYQGDSLELWEIREGFEMSEMKKHSFELVGFDACLMGTVETAYMMPDNVKYIAASPEVEPGEGWNYKWLDILNQEKTGETIGREIGLRYAESIKGEEIPLSLSVVNVSKLKRKCREWNKILEKKEWNRDELTELLIRGSAMQGYQSDVMGLKESELVGCEEMMKELCGEKGEAKQLLNGISVNYGNEAAASKNSTLSIYFPNEYLSYEKLSIYENCGFINGYFKMLKDMYDELGEGGITYEEQRVKAEGETIAASVPAEAVENILWVVQTAVYVDNGQSYIISTDTDVIIEKNGNISAKVPKYYMALQGEIFAALEEKVVETYEENYVDVISPVLHNGQLSFLRVRFSEEYPGGEILGVAAVGENGESLKKISKLNIGDLLAPMYPFENGYGNDAGEVYFKGHEFAIENDGETQYMESIPAEDIRDKLEYGFIIKMIP